MSGQWKDGRRHSDPGWVYLMTHTMLLMGIDVTASQKWNAENLISIQQIVERDQIYTSHTCRLVFSKAIYGKCLKI